MWHVMEWSMVSEDGNWADFGEEGWCKIWWMVYVNEKIDPVSYDFSPPGDICTDLLDLYYFCQALVTVHPLRPAVIS
jgi:hypothetical protein